MFKIRVSVLMSILLFSQMVTATPYPSNAQEWKLTEEQWDLMKQGEQLLHLPALRQAVETWSQQQGQAIELRYPGGEAGELWVEALKHRLISLAIPSKYLNAVAGSGEADVIIIKIVKAGDVSQ